MDTKVFTGLLISTRNKTRRLDGNFVKFFENRVVLLNNDLQFLGTRINGPICKEIRNDKLKELKYKRIISYAKATI